ncbi:hypothetical protein ACEWY4_022251 [Coilia grayii]|uniref:Fibronectin type-III domain-containing protein n=1 Tax=Coilia grayii TaxID=363190 RepID=A0ABD1J5I8_9TELE
MFPAAARNLLALYVLLSALCPLFPASKPLQPRNVKLTKVDKGLQVTWDPPNQLDGRPVERYNIGYGKSMRSLRFISVGADQRSEILEDVEPGVLHFLKMSAENEDGLSKPVYRAEVPGGAEFAKLDGFAVESSNPRNSSAGRFGGGSRSSPPQRSKRPLMAPQSSSGPKQPFRAGQRQPQAQSVTSHRVDVSQPQADQRNQNKAKLASESVYVVSLQAQRAQGRSAPTNKAFTNKKHTPEPVEVDDAEDITVRVVSPQSVVITWVDPLIEKRKKTVPEGTRQYTVRYREKGESARWEYKDATQRRLIVEALSADSMYEFSVRISDRGKHGKWSTSVFQRTPESAPSGPPENFQVRPLRGKGTAVTATWDPPDEPNGKIREYILSYTPALKPFGAKSVTYRGSTTSATIDGLQPGERYIFKIRAVNRRGQGPQTKAFSVAMPTSTSASSSSHPSRALDRHKPSIVTPDTSDDDYDYDETDSTTQETTTVTSKPQTQSTTASPASRRTRPLSQTRSYHSIFSSVRGSSRSQGSSRSRGRDGVRSRTEDEETPIDAPEEEEDTAVNEATEEEERKHTDPDPHNRRTPSKSGHHQDYTHSPKTPSKSGDHLDSDTHDHRTPSKAGHHPDQTHHHKMPSRTGRLQETDTHSSDRTPSKSEDHPDYTRGHKTPSKTPFKTPSGKQPDYSKPSVGSSTDRSTSSSGTADEDQESPHARGDSHHRSSTDQESPRHRGDSHHRSSTDQQSPRHRGGSHHRSSTDQESPHPTGGSNHRSSTDQESPRPRGDSHHRSSTDQQSPRHRGDSHHHSSTDQESPHPTGDSNHRSSTDQESPRPRGDSHHRFSTDQQSPRPRGDSDQRSSTDPDQTSGHPRRPLTRNPVLRSRIRNGNGGSSSSSSSSASSRASPSVDGRRDSNMAGYPDKKDTHTRDASTSTHTRNAPTSSTPKETRPEAKSSSSSSSSTSSSSTSSPSPPDSSSSSSSTSSSSSPSSRSGQPESSQAGSGTGRFTGSGSVMINGRKVSLPSRWSHILSNRRKPGSGSASTSSSGSQSTPHNQHQSPKKVSPTSSDSQGQNQSPDKVSSPSPSIQDTINPQEIDGEGHRGTQKQTAKDKEPTVSYETSGSHSSVGKEDAAARTDKDGEDDKQGSSPESSTRQSPSPSPSLPGRGAIPAVPSRNARPGTVQRFPPRQDGRIPWSRTSSSSVGNRRPISRGTPSRSGISETPERGDKTRTGSSLYPSKHKVDDTPIKPSVLNRDRVSSGSRLPSNTRTESHTPKQSSQTDNDHEDDYDYDDYDNYDKVAEPTAALKTTTSTTTTTTTTAAPTTTTTTTTTTTASPVQNSGDYNERRTRIQSVPTDARRPLQGSNGRTRTPVVSSNRHNGSRFLGRLTPVQHTKLGSKPESSSPHSSASASSFPSQSSRVARKPSQEDTSDRRVPSPGSGSQSLGRQIPGVENSPGTSSGSQSSSPVVRSAVVGSRLRNPSRFDSPFRGKPPVNGFKPSYGQGGKNGRPNLTTSNGKITSPSSSETKAHGRKHINGPDGMKWVVDLDKGVLMNHEGKVLQDSNGQPHRVVLGEDGRTVFDLQGTPLVNQDGLALFGNGRDSQPVMNPKEKMLTVGGKPIVGLDRPRARTPKIITTTTTTTTTPEPTTVSTTTEMTTEESMTTEASPTCPPGHFFEMDEDGQPMLNDYGVLDCYPEDEFVVDGTDPTTTETPTTTSTTTTTTATTLPTPSPDTRPFNSSPSSEFDLAGKKRFTAPYVNYIRKDPGAPCSLTEALEYLQVDVLADLMKKDSFPNLPPKNKPHNITVVAMEGCHSFVIIDWDRPLADDSVSGYLVHSASYDDVLNNRWSTSPSSGTHLPVENLKPNSRYYFKIQAKNVFGLGPVSDTLVYVTESDDPLLIDRPPGGEPIWVSYKFRYNPAHSSCKGSQFVKRTWYRKFVGVVLCNSLRYKIFMADGLRDTFYSVADSFGYGEDHCQFVDSHLDGRTGPHSLSMYLPPAQGYYRSYRQEPVNFGRIGRQTPHNFVGWYECGIPIPGKW